MIASLKQVGVVPEVATMAGTVSDVVSGAQQSDITDPNDPCACTHMTYPLHQDADSQ